jgi:hypothetical protein
MSGMLSSVNDAGWQKISIGATAMAAIAGITAPLFGWWLNGPIIAICAIVAAWGIWPLIKMIGANLVPWRRLSLTEAARLIYRRASPSLRTMIAGENNQIEAWGRERLYVYGAAGQITLKGKRGPGLPYEKIPPQEIESLRLSDDDTLCDNGITHYIDIVVSRSDAILVLRESERELVGV